MKEWLSCFFVIIFIVPILYWAIEWITLPRYIEKIGNELKEIKEVLKDKNL